MAQMDDAVRALLELAEMRAERLVAQLRLIVSSSLAIVFIVVLTREPVPLTDVLRWQLIYAGCTMAVYFAFGLASLFVLRRGWFRRWMVWPSAMADCAFVLVSLWLSVANTGLPGTHLAIFPTMWLIPVVLACGALRFNPAVQVFMALAIVGGLLGLLGIEATSGDAPVWSVMGFSFAMPPNLMRVAMIVLAGGVLVVASVRIRRLLVRSITEAEARTNLTRYLPEQLVPRLAQGGLEDLRRGARVNMAILFIDMRGFTHLAETMTPEQLSAFMTAYRARITAAVRETDGIIDKFMGDAAMVVFEDGNGRAARTALHCAELMTADIATWSAQRVSRGEAPVLVGVGLHWGEVFVGVVGDTTRLEYSVFGDSVNIAARLEALTKGHGVRVIASHQFLQQSGADLVNWQELPDRSVRGRSGEMRLFALP